MDTLTTRCVIYRQVGDADKILLCEIPLGEEPEEEFNKQNEDGRTVTYRRTDAPLELEDGVVIIWCADETGNTVGHTVQCADQFARRFNVHPCTAVNEDDTPCRCLLQAPGKRCYRHRYCMQPFVCPADKRRVQSADEVARTERRIYHFHIDGQPQTTKTGRTLFFVEIDPGAPCPLDKTFKNGSIWSWVLQQGNVCEYDTATGAAWVYDGQIERPLRAYCKCDTQTVGCPCLEEVDTTVVSYNIFPCAHVNDDGGKCTRFLRQPGTCWRHSLS